MSNELNKVSYSVSGLLARFLRRVNLLKAALFLKGQGGHYSSTVSEGTRLVADRAQIQDHLKGMFWAIDRLYHIVTFTKKNLGLEEKQSVRLETLSIQTYLFHIERLLVQIREHAYHIQFRANQTSWQNENLLKQFEIVINSSKRCKSTILKLVEMIESKGIKKLENNNQFFALVNALELQASELSSDMRKFNQNYFQKQSIHELFEMENVFLENFLNSKVTEVGMLNFPSRYELEVITKQKGTQLSQEISNIPDPQYQLLADVLIEILEDLKKCYVVSRKSIINKTLDCMSDDIEALIQALQAVDKSQDDAVDYLRSIYHGLESLYFSTNTDSRCSRNLFDKSKEAKRKLRKVCGQSEIGLQFLKQITLRKTIFQRN